MQSPICSLICLLRSEVGHIQELWIPWLYPSVAEQSLWNFQAPAMEKPGWEKLLVTMVRSVFVTSTLHEKLFSLQNVWEIAFQNLHSSKEKKIRRIHSAGGAHNIYLEASNLDAYIGRWVPPAWLKHSQEFQYRAQLLSQTAYFSSVSTHDTYGSYFGKSGTLFRFSIFGSLGTHFVHFFLWLFITAMQAL